MMTISRKAAQQIIRDLKKVYANTTTVKGNAKQADLLAAIESVQQKHDISSIIARAVQQHPLVEKAAAKPRANKTTKTIEQDNSSAAQLKVALQEIERLKAEAAKPQSDAESRLADCQRELSETIEALTHANQSISNLRDTNVELVRKANEVSKKLREAEQTIEKNERALVIAREQIKQLTIKPANANNAQLKADLTDAQNKLKEKENELRLAQETVAKTNEYAMNEIAKLKTKVNVTPDKSEPKIVAEMRAAIVATSLFADDKPALSACGVANLLGSSDKMELARSLQRLVSGGFISLHPAPQEYLDKFSPDVFRKWTLPNGSFLITLN